MLSDLPNVLTMSRIVAIPVLVALVAWRTPVGDGLAQAPTALLNPPESLGADGRAAYNKAIGGSFAGVDEVGRRNPVPTRLHGTEDEPKYADWGEVSEVTYPMARDAYDKRTTPETRWGWAGEGFAAALDTRNLTPDGQP